MKENNEINIRDINKILFISLTGKEEDKQKVIIELGQGSFSIGIKGIDDGRVDALANADDVIDWKCFDNLNIKCYCPWPRFFSYIGNDLGFIEWSKKRKIEEFEWYPQKDMKADFSEANIYKLSLHDCNHKVKVILGENISTLQLHGNINNFDIENCKNDPILWVFPIYEKKEMLYRLPTFKSLKNIKEIHIHVSALDDPFDCSSLLQFPNLESLYLSGNVININSIKKFKKLEELGIWDAPNLSGFPSLDNWNLKYFVAMNIDEKVGNNLKAEVRKLKKEKRFAPDAYTYVGKLRNELWFLTEYGLPFSSWPITKEKKATSAYKICLKNVKSAKSEDEVKNAIVEFTNKINKLEDIDTIERDDTYIALSLIMKNSKIYITEEKWRLWFDETRDF